MRQVQVILRVSLVSAVFCTLILAVFTTSIAVIVIAINLWPNYYLTTSSSHAVSGSQEQLKVLFIALPVYPLVVLAAVYASVNGNWKQKAAKVAPIFACAALLLADGIFLSLFDQSPPRTEPKMRWDMAELAAKYWLAHGILLLLLVLYRLVLGKDSRNGKGNHQANPSSS